MTHSWDDRISSLPAVLAGKPHIKSSRISVEFLMGRLADGWSYKDLQEAYPALTQEDIFAAMSFAQESQN